MFTELLKIKSFKVKIIFSLAFLFFTFNVNPVSAATINRSISVPGNNLGLVSWYTFDGPDMYPNIRDRSGNGYHGDLFGQQSTTTVIGKLGQALSFDGIDDKVIVNHSTAFDLSDSTFSVWINHRSGSYGWQTFMAINTDEQSFAIQFDYLNIVGRCGIQGVMSIPTDGWHHIVWYISGSNYKVYVDGVEQASGGGCSASVDGYQFSLGNWQDNEWFNGLIDEVRVYSRVLSLNEIKGLYNSGSVKFGVAKAQGALATGLIGHWTFDGKNMISNVADSSGMENNGRLVTVTSTTTTAGVIGQAYVSPRDTSTNAYIDTGSNYIGTNSFSICFWAKMNTNSGNFLYNSQTIMTTNSSNRFGLTRDNTVSVAVSAVDAVVLNKWQHYCATSNTVSNTINLYLNGVLNGGADQSSGAPGVGATNVRLLGEGSGSTVDGAVDDMRIYNRVLSATEIKTLYNSSNSKFAVTPNSGKASLNSGLVGHWTFDGKNMISNVADSSGGGNNGRLVGFTSTTTAVGKIGQALFFDGDDDYINVSNSASLDNIWDGGGSVSFWVNPKSGGEAGAGFWLQNGFYALFASIGPGETGFEFDINWSGGDAKWRTITANLTFNKWHHVFMVYNSDSVANDPVLYVDGSIVSLTEIVTPTGTRTSDAGSSVQIGSNTAQSRTIDGLMDDVRVYNTSLSQSEIIKLYNLGR
jgi:hypothetical protein